MGTGEIGKEPAGPEILSDNPPVATPTLTCKTTTLRQCPQAMKPALPFLPYSTVICVMAGVELEQVTPGTAHSPFWLELRAGHQQSLCWLGPLTSARKD
jgi:hypothetical protein